MECAVSAVGSDKFVLGLRQAEVVIARYHVTAAEARLMDHFEVRCEALPHMPAVVKALARGATTRARSGSEPGQCLVRF